MFLVKNAPNFKFPLEYFHYLGLIWLYGERFGQFLLRKHSQCF